MGKTNWDRYYENLRKDPKTKVELDKAGYAIDIAVQIYTLRQRRGLTQKELAGKMGIKQSNISRLEDADYKGYSLRSLEKIASALSASPRISFIPTNKQKPNHNQNIIGI